MFDFIDVIQEFLVEGGQVLSVIFLVTFVLWALILQKLLYFKITSFEEFQDQLKKWEKRSDKSSWFAHRVRDALISSFKSNQFKHINTIKTLVSLCPLLGLMGTVTGMISVFDIMAITGTGNARLMASGISMATIPTMAGMVAALSGLYFGTKLEQKAKTNVKKLSEQLSYS